jgi:hypothetical protein
MKAGRIVVASLSILPLPDDRSIPIDHPNSTPGH